MKDYHQRRRTQNQNGAEGELRRLSQSRSPSSAKSLTQKFRSGQGKGLRLWKPVKPPARKHRDGKNGLARGRSRTRRSPQRISLDDSSVGVEWNHEYNEIASTHASPTYTVIGANDKLIDEWKDNLDLALHTSMLYDSPGTGVLDPFDAMSLLITPRVQLLLHHYCE